MLIGLILISYNFNNMFKKPKVVTLAFSSELSITRSTPHGCIYSCDGIAIDCTPVGPTYYAYIVCAAVVVGTMRGD